MKKRDSFPTFTTVHQIHHLNLHLLHVYYLKNKGVNKEKANCISLKNIHIKNGEKFMEAKSYMEPVSPAEFTIY